MSRYTGRWQSLSSRIVLSFFAAIALAATRPSAPPTTQAAGSGHAAKPRVYLDKVEPNWFDHGNCFWYRNDLKAGRRQFILVDAVKGTRKPAFDHVKLAAALGAAGGSVVDPERLPIESLEFSDDRKSVRLTGLNSYVLDLGSYALTPIAEGDGSRLAPLQKPHKSLGSDWPTKITFINHGSDEIEVFWINTAGERVSYGKIAAGAQHEQPTFAGHVWVACDADGRDLAVFEARKHAAMAMIEPRERHPDGEADVPGRSPDGKQEVFVREHNLWLREVSSGQEQPLTQDATSGDTYHYDVMRERAIGMWYDMPEPPEQEPLVFWSPDSRHVVAMKTHTVPGRMVFVVESSPKDQLQPKLLSYPYLKAGDPIPIAKPHLFDAAAHAEVPIGEELFPTPWSIDGVRWAPNSSQFTFLYNQRGHQVMRMLSADAATGQVRTIIDEHSDTFIDYADKTFYEFLDDTSEIIWMSERDGWNHLYLYDARTGQVKNQITCGHWVVRNVEHVDARKRQIWFRAGAIYPKQDPYFIHHCRINFDGTGLVLLTEGNGTHNVSYSPDRRFLLDTWSRVDAPPMTELRRSDSGERVCALEQADASEWLAVHPRLPEPFAAKGRDGETDICGVIFRPSDFDPARKYPVVEAIYAGPQDSYVPKSFRKGSGLQKLADHGFIVVQIDGMGTNNRSRKFHDVCWKNLADAGFADRIAWMKSAGAKYPEMDLSRVGIFGTSAGGQNALGALLFHGDFYKVGVADCGCHDNRMDKIWWSEQWMGWPVGPQYEQCSNVANAWRLTGKLMLLVGEVDHNVDPSSTMQVVNALEKANKDFELVVVTGSDHGAAGSPFGARKRMEFLVKNLIGAEGATNEP